MHLCIGGESQNGRHMQAEQQSVEATGEAAPEAMAVWAEAEPDDMAEALAARSAQLRAILENSGTRVLDFFRKVSHRVIQNSWIGSLWNSLRTGGIRRRWSNRS